ncbi:hypothetical protein [Brevibacillus dissolubilis]|uniref:hypothetical protein n=1 Tax=Brevibacillus dissolubilis TaxID=1844116 RepID=UPI0011164F25|nr:hypothetical protein [Brevibacillus dissolubilis]
MIKRKGSRLGTLLALTVVLLVGCSDPQNTAQNADAQFKALRSNFSKQQGYSFHGWTRLLTGFDANGNLVNFAGQVNGKDAFVSIKTSVPDQKKSADMAILSRDNQLYAKLGEQEAWRPVGDQEFSLRQQLANWSPEFSFQQMERMRTKVVPLRDENKDDNLASVRVLLDSRQLKQMLSDQLRAQVDANSQGANVQAVQSAYPTLTKGVFTLSRDQLGLMGSGARIQQAKALYNIDELIEDMQLEAEYTVYYDIKRNLPTMLEMEIRSNYDMNEQRVSEHSRIQTYIWDYGQKFELPSPGMNTKGLEPAELVGPGTQTPRSLPHPADDLTNRQR